MYVDDYLSSVDEVETSVSLIKDVTKLFSKGDLIWLNEWQTIKLF